MSKISFEKNLARAAIDVKKSASPHSTRELFDKYFNGRPAADDLEKAYYAYHIKHPRLDHQAHSFWNDARSCVCNWCGRTRAQVRWDDLPPGCAARPTLPSIVEVLSGEEEPYMRKLITAAQVIPELLAKKFNGQLTGTVLAELQHTYGYDPDSVASALDLEVESLMNDFEVAMEAHRANSRSKKL